MEIYYADYDENNPLVASNESIYFQDSEIKALSIKSIVLHRKNMATIVYVPSKGRADYKARKIIDIPYYCVTEDDDYEKYKAEHETIIKYTGKEYCKTSKFQFCLEYHRNNFPDKHCLLLDDDITGFMLAETTNNKLKWSKKLLLSDTLSIMENVLDETNAPLVSTCQSFPPSDKLSRTFSLCQNILINKNNKTDFDTNISFFEDTVLSIESYFYTGIMPIRILYLKHITTSDNNKNCLIKSFPNYETIVAETDKYLNKKYPGCIKYISGSKYPFAIDNNKIKKLVNAGMLPTSIKRGQ